MAAPDFSSRAIPADVATTQQPPSDAKLPDFSTRAMTPPVQMQGGWRTPAMIGSNVVKGFAGTAGLPGDVLQTQGFSNPILNIPEMALSGATRQVLDWLGIPQEKVPMVPGELPTSAQYQAPLKQAGIVDRSDLAPQDEGEKVISAASQGVGASLPFALVGGPLAALRTAVSGATGGAGAYEGGKYGGEYFGPKGEQVGQLVGGIVGGGGTDIAIGGVGKVGSALLNRPSPTLGPYDRLQITPRMVGDVTGSPTLQFAQDVGAKMPGGIATTERAAKATANEFADAVHRSADQFGPHQTAQDAGQTLQDSVHQWIEKVLPARRKIAWAPVNQAIASGEPTPLVNYRAKLEKLTGQTPGMEASGAALAPDKANQLLAALNIDVPAGAAVPWGTAQEILHRIGDQMGVPEFVQKMGKNNLNALYKALHDDMAATADRLNVRPYFDQANRISTDNYVIRDRLAHYSPARNPALEMVAPDSAANRALHSNSDLQLIRQEIPPAADALAAYELRGLGRKGGTGGAEGEGISSASFLTNLNNKRFSRSEGTRALYGSDQNVADLSHVAQDMKATTKFANTSGTAGHSAMAETYRTIATALPSALVGVGTHEVLPALGALIGMPLLGYGVSRAVTSPLVSRIIGSPSLVTRGRPIPEFVNPALLKKGSGGLLGVP